jgi:hypothetical protein
MIIHNTAFGQFIGGGGVAGGSGAPEVPVELGASGCSIRRSISSAMT